MGHMYQKTDTSKIYRILLIVQAHFFYDAVGVMHYQVTLPAIAFAQCCS